MNKKRIYRAKIEETGEVVELKGNKKLLEFLVEKREEYEDLSVANISKIVENIKNNRPDFEGIKDASDKPYITVKYKHKLVERMTKKTLYYDYLITNSSQYIGENSKLIEMLTMFTSMGFETPANEDTPPVNIMQSRDFLMVAFRSLLRLSESDNIQIKVATTEVDADEYQKALAALTGNDEPVYIPDEKEDKSGMYM